MFQAKFVSLLVSSSLFENLHEHWRQAKGRITQTNDLMIWHESQSDDKVCPNEVDRGPAYFFPSLNPRVGDVIMLSTEWLAVF